MAQVTKTVCDVFGTSNNVNVAQVTVKSGEATVYHATAELSPRAMNRLERFIQRGLVSAAKWKERDDAR